MKKFYFVFLLIGTVACSKDQEFETDYKVYEVQGAVRQVAYKSVGNEDNDAIAIFNKNGMLVSEKMRGRSFEYQYDGMYVRSLKAFIGDSLELRRTYTYENDLPIEIREYASDGTYRKRVVYDYDENRNRTRCIVLSPYKDTLFVWNYIIENNKVQKEIRTSKQAQLEYEQTYVYEYEEDGNMLSVMEYEDSQIISKTEYKTYHGVALPSKKVQYWNGELLDSTIMTYGFDEKGNWIFKRTVPSRGHELRQERTILYYK